MVYEYKPEVYLCFYIMDEDTFLMNLDGLNEQSAILLMSSLPRHPIALIPLSFISHTLNIRPMLS